MPRPTRKQLASPARCRLCDRELGRLRNAPGLGPFECCCRDNYCLDCCPDNQRRKSE